MILLYMRSYLVQDILFIMRQTNAQTLKLFGVCQSNSFLVVKSCSSPLVLLHIDKSISSRQKNETIAAVPSPLSLNLPLLHKLGIQPTE